MKKSIYYLVANALSIVAALIFLNVVGNKFPVFDLSLQVTSLGDTFTSFVLALPVLALSIVVTTREVVLNEAKPSLLSKVLSLVTAVLTIVSVGFTWFSAVLVFDNYSNFSTISLPIVFLVSYVVGVALLFVSPVLSNKNQNLGATLVATSLVLMVASVVFECLEKENALVAGIVCGVVVLLTFAVPTVLSLVKKNK